MGNYALAKIASAQTIVTTAETVVYTTPAVVTGLGDAGVWFSGDIQLTYGAGTTAVTFRLRATNVSGAIVDSTAAIPVTASATSQLPFNFFDLSNLTNQQGGQVYVITVQQTGATGNATVNGGHVGIEV